MGIPDEDKVKNTGFNCAIMGGANGTQWHMLKPVRDIVALNCAALSSADQDNESEVPDLVDSDDEDH